MIAAVWNHNRKPEDERTAWMSQKLYLRPTGLLHGDTAVRAIGKGLALPLASMPVAFSCAEVVEGTALKSKRSLYSVADLRSSVEPALQALIKNTVSPRASISGLSLERTRLMGIVNITPDSFSEHGEHGRHDLAIAHARDMIEQGADIIDVGGESTRPGAEKISQKEELSRVLDVIHAIAGDGALVSADTRRPDVMKQALKAGAKIINDVTALTFEEKSAEIVASSDCPVVLMHIRGEPKTMQNSPYFDDVVLEVYDDLENSMLAAERAGIARKRMVIDPGIGFGKTFSHNLQLLENLSIFHGLGAGLLVGLSRKGFLGAVTGVRDAGKRVHGSIGAAFSCIIQGVHILRVHDLAATKQALDAWEHAMGLSDSALPRHSKKAV